MKKLNLNAIRIDGGTQPRERINMEVVGDYAEAVKVGIEFPPIVVFHDGVEHWLADGFHRWHAHKQADKASILADVRQGSLDDAKLFASGCNGEHGLRRSNADKRLAVLMALGVKADWSDNRLAKHVGVSHTFVADQRRSILHPLQDTKDTTPVVRTAERAGKTYQQDTGRIGKPAAIPERKPKRELPITAPPPPDSDALAEAQHTITELAEENEKLRDQVAIEAMDTSETAKTEAADTIRELRARVKTLEAENSALKVSRDTYQREANEAKKDAIYWRTKAQKLERAAA